MRTNPSPGNTSRDCCTVQPSYYAWYTIQAPARLHSTCQRVAEDMLHAGPPLYFACTGLGISVYQPGILLYISCTTHRPLTTVQVLYCTYRRAQKYEGLDLPTLLLLIHSMAAQRCHLPGSVKQIPISFHVSTAYQSIRQDGNRSIISPLRYKVPAWGCPTPVLCSSPSYNIWRLPPAWAS